MQWPCSACTLLNGFDTSSCAACEKPRSEPGAASSQGLGEAGGAASSSTSSLSAEAGPNCHVDLYGRTVVRRPLAPGEGLTFEDGSRVRSGQFSVGADGVITLLSGGDAGGDAPARGLPAEDAQVKWCSKCSACCDGRWSLNAWVFRCDACLVDLCGACYNLPRGCAHEYRGIAPGGGMGRPRPSPPPPGKPGRWA